MDNISLVIHILDIVKWPATIIIILFLFRKSIINILGNLSKIRYKRLILEFQKILKDSEIEAKKLKILSPEDIKINFELIGISSDGKTKIPLSLIAKSSSLYSHLIQISETSAKSAIIDSWRLIEYMLDEIAKEKNIKTKNHLSRRNILLSLLEENERDEVILKLFDNLYMVRNSAVHLKEKYIDKDAAHKYINIALSLSGLFLILERKKRRGN